MLYMHKSARKIKIETLTSSCRSTVVFVGWAAAELLLFSPPLPFIDDYLFMNNCLFFLCNELTPPYRLPLWFSFIGAIDPSSEPRGCCLPKTGTAFGPTCSTGPAARDQCAISSFMGATRKLHVQTKWRWKQMSLS